MRGAAVLFDVDGTLTDTTYLHALAWWRALVDAGHDVAMAAVHRLVGMGSSELLTSLLGHDDAGLSDAHGRQYQRLKGEIRPLPGARDLLEAVSGRGAAVVLATSAKQRDVGDLLRSLDAEAWIDHVVHAGDVEEAKPEGDIFSAALEAAGCPPERALVVGDTVWDVEAAAKVGVPTVAVLTGGHSTADLLDAGAVAVYRDPADLLGDLDTSPVGALLSR